VTKIEKGAIYNEAKIKRQPKKNSYSAGDDSYPKEKEKSMSFIEAMINCTNAKYRQNS